MKRDIVELLNKMNGPEKGISRLGIVEDYADKILKTAIIVPYYIESTLRAFIAYYTYNINSERAFMTMLVIDEDCQRMGIGRNLVNFSIVDIKMRGFKYYGLEVMKTNTKAIGLYQSLGFEIKEDRMEVWFMEKDLA